MRRRLRERRRVREALLLDLGALVYELHRQGRRAPELLQQKAAELTVVDDEVRELQAVLDGAGGEGGEAQAPEPAPATEESEVADLEAELADEESFELDEEPAPDELEDEPAPDETEDEPALAEHEEPHA